jgi:hypothetical protein
MIKFVWCLGHHGNGRFTEEPRSIYGHEKNSSVWKCLDCDAVMKKVGSELNLEHRSWTLMEVIDDSD